MSKPSWTPTHKITFTPAEGAPRVYLVELDEGGAAYTEQEALWCEPADWELVDGTWRFQGQVTPGGAPGEVVVERLPPRRGRPRRDVGTRKAFQIRAHDGGGELVCVITLDVDECGRVSGQGALEHAATLAGKHPAVRARFRGPSGGFWTNRETGIVGMSGIFGLLIGGSHHGQIHVREAP